MKNSVIFLKSDNFTPLIRTPWAGRTIADTYKSHISSVPDPIGESWEFSCDPQMPSRCRDTGQTIIELSETNSHIKDALTSHGVDRLDISVKLLCTSEPLSLQLHPFDDDPGLAENECGKPESWYILEAEEGAGIYLGFNKNYSVNELHTLLLSGEKAHKCLHFIPVKPGDYFSIKPGVPHAIGPGVTLIEPQLCRFGKEAKTYRMWDWGRLYDSKGHPSTNGSPRDLHLDDCLRILKSIKTVHGPDLEKSCQTVPEKTSQMYGFEIATYPCEGEYFFSTWRSCEPTSYDFMITSGYGVFSVLNGCLNVDQKKISKGESFLLLPGGKVSFEGSDLLLGGTFSKGARWNS